MTQKKVRALQALLTEPTKGQAAAKAGIDPRTLHRYLTEDLEFQLEYRAALSGLVSDAATQAKQSLSPALSCLREVVEDEGQAATARISAARSLLEYGLRLAEITDILHDLERAEADHVL